VLQFVIQLPAVFQAGGAIVPSLSRGDPGTRTVLRNFVPAFVGRGVVQISAFVDAILASFLPTGALAALANAQILYTLPVSLFGMSVSAAELPGLSAEAGAGRAGYDALRSRIETGMSQIAFFVVPSMLALASLGHVIAAAVFQTGLFSQDDARYVWGILAGSSIGLLAGTLGRLYASAWYALQDTRTPLRFAVIRVALTLGLGYLAALHLPGWLGIPARWGAAGLTVSAGIAGWVEFLLLRRSLDRRVGSTRLPAGYAVKLWIPGLLAVAASWGVLLLEAGRLGPIARAALVLLPFGIVYLGGTLLLKVPLALRLAGRISAV
jgi:putative peptidoglycan lipid II flippase